MNLVADFNLELLALKVIIDKPETLPLFESSYFANPAHNILFRKLEKAITNKDKLDRHLLVSSLSSSDQLQLVGGEKFVDSLFEVEYEEEFIENYSSSLSDLRTKRETQHNLLYIINKAPKSSLAELASGLADVHKNILDKVGIEEADSFQDLLEIEKEKILSGDMGNFIPTCFNDYDKLIGGMELSNLEIIAARPSVGKTSLMLRLALNVAKNRVPIDIISLEMSNSQIVQRMLSMESGIPSHRLKTGKLKEDERQRLKVLIPGLQSLPIHVSYKSCSSIIDTSNRIRIMAENHGVKVFFVDYVQLFNMNPGNETNEIYNICRKLKSLAVELNVNIQLISQLSRSVEQRKDKRPILSDLRQSGGLEENADKVTFIYRDYYYTRNPADLGVSEIILAKNRNGPTGLFNLWFDEETTDFKEL